MILLIDNYDSFTYNLYQLMLPFGQEVKVVRNDETTVQQIGALRPDAIVLSPGPGRPEQSGICPEAVRVFGGERPILGVCLGHQVIAQVHGARIEHAPEPVHGKATRIQTDGAGLFEGLPERFSVGRYHSLAIDPHTLPEEFSISARTECGDIMAIRHRTRPLYGVQFHPESILTEHGSAMMRTFLEGTK